MPGRNEASHRDPHGRRRPYNPPRLGCVSLVADEVLAPICKTQDVTTSARRWNPSCGIGTFLACLAQGS